MISAGQIVVEVLLITMIAALLYHAVRLERALGSVRRDRAELSAMLDGFQDSTRQAEQAIDRLRASADSAGRVLARQIDGGERLRNDLAALGERGERVADRLEALVRLSRDIDPGLSHRAAPEPAELAPPKVRSQAERDLLRALRVKP